jgi:hypothetical protein
MMSFLHLSSFPYYRSNFVGQVGELVGCEFSSQAVIHCICEILLHAAKLGHGTDYLTSPP